MRKYYLLPLIMALSVLHACAQPRFGITAGYENMGATLATQNIRPQIVTSGGPTGSLFLDLPLGKRVELNIALGLAGWNTAFNYTRNVPQGPRGILGSTPPTWAYNIWSCPSMFAMRYP